MTDSNSVTFYPRWYIWLMFAFGMFGGIRGSFSGDLMGMAGVLFAIIIPSMRVRITSTHIETFFFAGLFRRRYHLSRLTLCPGILYGMISVGSTMGPPVFNKFYFSNTKMFYARTGIDPKKFF
jgi:hypothetical protein